MFFSVIPSEYTSLKAFAISGLPANFSHISLKSVDAISIGLRGGPAACAAKFSALPSQN